MMPLNGVAKALNKSIGIASLESEVKKTRGDIYSLGMLLYDFRLASTFRAG